jgi:hypothetical protein
MLGWTILSILYFLLVSHINTLNAELNPICHLLALLGAHHIFHVSRIRVNLCTPLLEPGRSVGIVVSLLVDFLGNGTQFSCFSKAYARHCLWYNK